jgi:glycosyltransferase involved in cell wall biosynthesis
VKIAVLMAAYNAAPYVGDALASLLQQRDAVALDVIVVNDGSTDSTGEIVRGIAARAPEVRYVETENRGISAARNRALVEVAPDTDLISVLDADDLSPAGRFARDVKQFEADPGLEFHFGRTRAFRDLGEDRLTPDTKGRFVDIRNVQLGAMLMRLELARSIGKFDATLQQAEDTDYLFRMFQLRPKISIVDDICVYYRRHASNVTRDLKISERYHALAILEHAKRRRLGGAPVPPGFFDLQSFKDILWW